MIAAKWSMRGTTLVELMIVVVIIGILAAAAYLGYRKFSTRATRTEAKAALLKAAVNQERYFLQNKRFSADLNQLGFSASPYTTDTGSYVIDIVAPSSAANFLMTATYQLGGAEFGKCAVFTIDDRGVKTSQPALDCWTKAR